ncbi:hypothetical protein Q8F55_000096 [Vanrija albida]|uniref:Uncharacterized protein n=1 Tax=Vanrija albida TaxID=181172 RepID=A0ABR3QCW1_9TREE
MGPGSLRDSGRRITLHILFQQVTPYLPWDLRRTVAGSDPVGPMIALAPDDHRRRPETGQHAVLYSVSRHDAPLLAEALNTSLVSEVYLFPVVSPDTLQPDPLADDDSQLVQDVLALLLASLDVPTLRILSIGFALLPTAVAALASYLHSSRARGLQHLILRGTDGDALPLHDLELLLPAIASTGTVRMLQHGAARTVHGHDADAFPLGGAFPGFSHPEARLLTRMLGALARNGAFLWPARRAAVRALVPARVILRHGGQPRPGIARLPAHVLLDIARRVSGDPEVFDTAQWSKLLDAARDPDGLKRLAWAVTRLDLTKGLGFKAVMAMWLDSGGFWPRSGSAC